MSEETNPSESVSENAKPETTSPPAGKRGKKLWLMIAAIVVAILLVSTALYAFVLTGLSLSISPKVVDIDAGKTVTLNATAKWGMSKVGSDAKYLWSISPSTLGSFNMRAKPSVQLTAQITEGSGTLTCEVTYKGKTEVVTKTVTVKPPYLDSISITPAVKTMVPGSNYTFTATPISSVALPISGVTLTWTVSNAAMGTLNVSTGPSVRLTVGTTLGNLTLSASGTYEGVSKTGDATITVGLLPPRKFDYLWYDMFNVPFGPWWEMRWEVYETEQPLTSSYPYLFKWYGAPKGNEYVYTNMRMNMTGRNVSELNMNEKPEFIPFMSETERGGTAILDWYLQYLTPEEMTVYPDATEAWSDGWVVSLNGTTTLDKQASKAVLNITEDNFDNFNQWWSLNKNSYGKKYSDWLSREAGPARLDIYPAYEAPMQILTFNLDASKVGDNVVLRYDIVSWGMEVLLTRWMCESFMPTEWYFEDMNFYATIMPEYSNIDADAVVVYASYAYEGTIDAKPCWSWEAMYQDYITSTILHPHSDYDKYTPFAYQNTAPGSPLYGTMMKYDYAPGVWNLSTNETLTFRWPVTAKQLFLVHLSPGHAINYNDTMVVKYAEPMDFDFPGQILTNNTTGTLKFIGPIPSWDWSKNQTTHAWLEAEWDRLGIIPYGIPFIEFAAEHDVVRELGGFRMDFPSSIPAEDYSDLTVTALDQFGNVWEGFNGSVHFTSSDPSAVLPGDYTYLDAENGTHTFTGVRLMTQGSRTITAWNVSTPLLVNSTKTVNVLAKRTSDHIGVEVYYVPSVGVPEDVTITMYDQYNQVYVNNTGEVVAFVTNRSGEVIMPPDYTFQAGDNGVHTIAAGLNFGAVGWFNITVRNSTVASIAGSQTNIWVAPSPEEVNNFTVRNVLDMLVGQTSDVYVDAYDQYGKHFKRYTGTVHFYSNASDSTLPVDYTFVVGDGGTHKFVGGVSFGVPGWFNVTVWDTGNTSAIGSQDGIFVQLRPEKISHKMYGLMEQPWGEWWPWRYNIYETDILLNNEPGKYTMVYNPDKLGYQGLIYAPYRWNTTAENVSRISVHDPEFMPILGTPNVPGAEAKLNVYFEYLSHDWWDTYWWPVWHDYPYWTGNGTMAAQEGDGYYLGVIITATMNREAAEEWMGLPQGSDPATWWATNEDPYYFAWSDWLNDQGNNIFDIWCGYEYPYSEVSTMLRLAALPSGDVQLTIAHVSWGMEVLMARWLNDTGICTHEPYWEDFDLTANYYSGWADVTFDGVGQYNMKAVRAYESATDETAWAWEPLLVDYVTTENSTGGGHPSEFNPWGGRNYTSRNALDPMYGEDVPYDTGLQNFSLRSFEDLTIQLRTDTNVLGYRGVKAPPEAITELLSGNKTAYTSNMVNGSMDLGWYSGGVDIGSMYNATTKTIHMQGPLTFDQDRFGNGAIKRGAPWIEFNVTVGAGSGSLLNGVANEPTALSGEPALLTELVALTMMAVGMLFVVVIFVSGRRK